MRVFGHTASSSGPRRGTIISDSQQIEALVSLLALYKCMSKHDLLPGVLRGNCSVVWQIPAATGLTLRVINNVVRKVDTKSKFYDAFRKDGYPATFEYKQKARPIFGLLSGCPPVELVLELSVLVFLRWMACLKLTAHFGDSSPSQAV